MLKLTEDEARGLDAIYKGVAIFAIMVGAAWTLTQYVVHRAEERGSAAIEARKPFLEKRLQVYEELVLAASTIASSEDPEMVRKAKEQFRILAAGPLLVVEDVAVGRATSYFSDCIQSPTNCHGYTLAGSAENLATECRLSLTQGFGIGIAVPRSPTNITVTAH